MTPMNRSIPVNPEQIKNSIKLLEVKIDMQQQKMKALAGHSEATRRLVSHLSREILHCPATVTPEPLRLWMATHHTQENAEKAVIDVAIAELESALAINKFMLDEAEKSKGSKILV